MEAVKTSKKRTNIGFEIVEAVPIDDTYEIVLGKRSTGFGMEWVTWFCKDKKNYFWGHYHWSRADAFADFERRIRLELSIK